VLQDLRTTVNLHHLSLIPIGGVATATEQQAAS